jgi:hypothetical protein
MKCEKCGEEMFVNILIDTEARVGEDGEPILEGSLKECNNVKTLGDPYCSMGCDV